MRKIFLVMAMGAGSCFAQTSARITDYIQHYARLAMEEQLRTGIPAAITLAQGIHESGAGQGELALSSNNHFGIKCKSDWAGDRVFHDDDSLGECFRAYGCVADSYKDHSDFLATGKRYSFLFDIDQADYKGWANGLKRAGYATNPKYPQILIRIIEENDLAAYTSLASNNSTESNASIFMAASSITEAPVEKPLQKEVQKEDPKKTIQEQPAPVKPAAVFTINNCKVITAQPGHTMYSIAQQQNIALSKLLSYNDMQAGDILQTNQLVYLQEKKKKGLHKIHEVQKGETAWMISQQEGIQLQKLLEHNSLSSPNKIKTGQLLYLHGKAPRS